jgi:hypothetical protein
MHTISLAMTEARSRKEAHQIPEIRRAGKAIIPRVGNLFSASCFFLLVVASEFGWRWAGSPVAVPHGPATVTSIAFDAIASFWLISAIALFFRSRVACLVSLLGVGIMQLMFLGILLEIAGAYFFPSEQMLNDRRNVGPVAHSLSLIVSFGSFAFCFALSAVLFVGLLRLRKELVHRGGAGPEPLSGFKCF